MSARRRRAVRQLLELLWWAVVGTLAVLLVAAAADRGDPVEVAFVATLGGLAALACLTERR